MLLNAHIYVALGSANNTAHNYERGFLIFI